MTATNWAEIEKAIYGAAFAIGDETNDAIIVSVQLLDRDGKEANWVSSLPFYLSSDAEGTTPAAAGTSITGDTDGAVYGVVLATSGMLLTDANGAVDIDIEHDTSADTMYLNVVLPTGQIVTSNAIAFADQT